MLLFFLEHWKTSTINFNEFHSHLLLFLVGFIAFVDIAASRMTGGHHWTNLLPVLGCPHRWASLLLWTKFRPSQSHQQQGGAPSECLFRSVMFFPPQPQTGSLSAVITAPMVFSLLRLELSVRIFLFLFLNIRVAVRSPNVRSLQAQFTKIRVSLIQTVKRDFSLLQYYIQFKLFLFCACLFLLFADLCWDSPCGFIVLY